MSEHMSGIHKGKEIMIETDANKSWRDHDKNVFIDRIIDIFTKKFLDTFQVSERMHDNTRRVWATSLPLNQAMNLAERLVVGKDYIPPSPRKATLIHAPAQLEEDHKPIPIKLQIGKIYRTRSSGETLMVIARDAEGYFYTLMATYDSNFKHFEDGRISQTVESPCDLIEEVFYDSSTNNAFVW